ncbi:hypothetical protein ACFWP0_23235 [Achromobacter sp. NPDC058515]|uniref:hypothetical protein n=1 Tax=Achromobacter sp. NPDC058515 TaxID=3346533 RepID=UPI00365AC10C
MSIARTYFFNKMGDDDLAGLFGKRENFFLENVDALNPTIARIQAMLNSEGMSSAVLRAPANPAPAFSELFPPLGLIGALFRALASSARPRADVTLRLTSNTSVSVIFARPRSSG